MTKINVSLPVFEEKTLSNRQTDVSRQRDSWSRQMELARLPEMGKPGAEKTVGEDASKPALSTSWSAILHRRPINPEQELQAPSSLPLPQTEQQLPAESLDTLTINTRFLAADDLQDAAGTPATGMAPAVDREQSRRPETLTETGTATFAAEMPNSAEKYLNHFPIKLPSTRNATPPSSAGQSQTNLAGNARSETIAEFSINPGMEQATVDSIPVATQAGIDVPAARSSFAPVDLPESKPVAPAATTREPISTIDIENIPAPQSTDLANNAQTITFSTKPADNKPKITQPITLIQAGEQAGAEIHASALPRENPVDHLSAHSTTPDEPVTMAGAALLSCMPLMLAQVVPEISVENNLNQPSIQAMQSRISAPLSITAAIAEISLKAPASFAEETIPEEALQQEAPAADAQSEEKPAWQKRLMHLTGEGEDIKLWIRDSKLNATQSQELIYRLAGDIAGMGLRLKDATVNGKLAFRSGTDDDAIDTPDSRSRARRSNVQFSSSPQTQQAVDSTNPTMEEEHGSQ